MWQSVDLKLEDQCYTDNKVYFLSENKKLLIQI